MTSETPTKAQDASVDAAPIFAHLSPEEQLAYLTGLAKQLTEWQHFVFNAAHQPNRVGMTEVAHQIQVAAYEARIMLGFEELDAKVAAGMMLTPEERATIQERLDEDRRKESVRSATAGLR